MASYEDYKDECSRNPERRDELFRYHFSQGNLGNDEYRGRMNFEFRMRDPVAADILMRVHYPVHERQRAQQQQVQTQVSNQTYNRRSKKKAIIAGLGGLTFLVMSAYAETEQGSRLLSLIGGTALVAAPVAYFLGKKD